MKGSSIYQARNLLKGYCSSIPLRTLASESLNQGIAGSTHIGGGHHFIWRNHVVWFAVDNATTLNFTDDQIRQAQENKELESISLQEGCISDVHRQTVSWSCTWYIFPVSQRILSFNLNPPPPASASVLKVFLDPLNRRLE
jgi:hypothetical protein